MTLATALAILGLIVLASACALLVIQRCEIADLQNVLLKLAKEKTEQLYLSTFPSALPDVHKGVRILKPKAS